jgi:N utilization substance protein A
LVATDQLSLAIGKGGQNVRLASKLTGMKITIAEQKADAVVEVVAEAAPQSEPETTPEA